MIKIEVTQQQREILEEIVRHKSETKAQLLERSQIILFSINGMTVTQQSRRLGIQRPTVYLWQRAWKEHQEHLLEAEKRGVKRKDYKTLIIGVLSDKQRPGKPPKFSAEQIIQIIAISCEKPEDSGLSISHWTGKEIANQAKKRGIVESISASYVNALLKKRYPSS